MVQDRPDEKSLGDEGCEASATKGAADAHLVCLPTTAVDVDDLLIP